MLWHQGESNHFLFTSVEPHQNAINYTNNFHLLANHLRDLKVTAPIYPAVATYCASNVFDTLLQQAQYALADSNLGIFNGPNTDMLGNEYRYDNCHFDETGLDMHATLWLEAIK